MTMLKKLLEVSSIEWQPQMVSIRAEVVYIQVELSSLQESGYDVTEIDEWLGGFLDASSDCLAAELNAYAEARRFDLGLCDKDKLLELYAKCKTPYYPWLKSLHEMIQRRQADCGEQADSPLMLLMACGTEMINANKRLMNSVDALIETTEIANP